VVEIELAELIKQWYRRSCRDRTNKNRIGRGRAEKDRAGKNKIGKGRAGKDRMIEYN
jgi:hypothetical protein